MPRREIIEETDSGYQRVAAVAVRCRGPGGSFVSEAEFLQARNAELCGSGYGLTGYGQTSYGQ